MCGFLSMAALQQLVHTGNDFHKCYEVISTMKLFFNAVPLQSRRPVNICFSLCPLCTVISMDSENLLMILCTVWWLNPQIPHCETLFLSCWTIYTNGLSLPVHTYSTSPPTHTFTCTSPPTHTFTCEGLSLSGRLFIHIQSHTDLEVIPLLRFESFLQMFIHLNFFLNALLMSNSGYI